MMFDSRSTPAVKAHPRVEALPALTSLRFFAAAYVLIFHFVPIYFPNTPRGGLIGIGYSGVTFFFLLSGFILAYNYRDADFSAAKVRSLFYRARLARIFPVYLLALAIHVPWFLNWSSAQPQPLSGLMLSGVVLAPLGLHAWVPGAACSLDCPSWSVSVEVFFYALFPVLLPVVLRAPVRVAVATLAFWFASIALSLALWQTFASGVWLIGPEPGGIGPVLLAEFIKYFPVMRLPEFMFGLLLFVGWRAYRPPAPVLVAIAAAAGVLILSFASRLPDVMLHNGVTMLAWAPLILACAQVRTGPLCARPLVFLGKISFALYLLHIPVFAALNTLDRVVLHGLLASHPWLGVSVNSLVSLAAATLVHLAVEEPGRRVILRMGGRASARPAPLPHHRQALSRDLR